jgi:hypothetical protein
MSRHVFVLAASLLACWPASLYAQALPNINSLQVRYNSLKTAAKAEGELKAQLDDVDKAIAEARRQGNAGEQRRQLAKGFVLLERQPWTPQADYRASLALRSERTVVDSSSLYAVRLEQIHRPAIDLTPSLTTKVTIRKRVPPARAGAPATPPPPSRDLGTFDGVARDLRESPYLMELDLQGVEDGAMVLQAEVFDGATSLGSTSLGVFVHKGLDARLKALETAAAGVAPSVRDDVLYPGDFIKNVNRARVELQDFNVTAGDCRGSQGRQGSVQGQDRRFRTALFAGGRQRDHAVSGLRAEGVFGVQTDRTRDCAAWPWRQRRRLLRQLQPAAAEARRAARVAAGRATRLPA